MLITSFLGSFAAAFCGIGPGGIFSMVLIYLGVQPTVGSATGMYLVFFTTLSASIQAMFFGQLVIDYAIYVQIITFFATFLGIFFQFHIEK